MSFLLTDDIEFMLTAGKEIFDEAREDKSHCWSLGALASLRETWKFVAQVAFMMKEEEKAQDPGQDWSEFGRNLSVDELELLRNLVMKADSRRSQSSQSQGR